MARNGALRISRRFPPSAGVPKSMEDPQHVQEADPGRSGDMGSAQQYLSHPQEDVQGLHQQDFGPAQHDLAPAQHDLIPAQHDMSAPQHEMGQHDMGGPPHDLGGPQHDEQAVQQQGVQQQGDQEQDIDPTGLDPTGLDPSGVDPHTGYLMTGQDSQYFNYAAHSAGMSHMDPNAHWQQQGELPRR